MWYLRISQICCIDIPLIDDALSSKLVEGQEHSAFETSMIGLLKVGKDVSYCGFSARVCGGIQLESLSIVMRF